MVITPANRLLEVEEYFFSKKLKEITRLKKQGATIINMGIGSPDFPPPKNVIEVMREASLEEGAHRYQSYQGLPELRNAFSIFYKQKYRVMLNPDEEIIPLMGSKEGIMHISMAFLNQGDEVLIPNPGYPTYTSVTKLVQAIPIYYNLNQKNGWLPDLKALEKTDLSKVKLMWINYPHMPTGANITKEIYERIVSFGIDHNILIINDNPYSFILNDNPLSILEVTNAKKVALELNSLSKTFNISGWRVGLVAGGKEYLHNVLKIKSNMDSGMKYAIQKGAIEALNINDNWYKTINEKYQKRKNLIFQIADKLKCTYDKNTSGMFVWAKLPNENTCAISFCDKLLYEKHIFITPGVVFGSQGNRYIRFSLCVDEKDLKEVIQRLKA